MKKFYPVKNSFFYVLVCCLVSVPFFSSAQISTFAGRHGYLGDGGAATGAGMYSPYGIAKDASGNIYIVTPGDNRARKVTASTNIIATLAGTGIAGYSGNGAAATTAMLSLNNSGLPGIGVDKSGNVYIGDYQNNVVRMVNSSGIISTFAGIQGNGGYSATSGSPTAVLMSGPAGIAADTAGNIYIVDNNNCLIWKVTASTGKISIVAGSYANGGFYSGDGGAATSAGLNYPERVALDRAGNLYISDVGNNVIRKVTVLTGIITTVAGSSAGTAGFSGDGGAATSAELNNPVGVSVDSLGNIYIADEKNNRIRKVTASTGIITTVAGGASAGYAGDGAAATSAELCRPSDVIADNAGNFYVCDFYNNRIRYVTASTGFISTAAGDGENGFNQGNNNVYPTALQAQLNPLALAMNYYVAAGNYDVMIADGNYYDVRDINAAGSAYPYAGTANPSPNIAKGSSGTGGQATVALFNEPVGVAADTSDNVYIADVNNSVIREVNYSTKVISTFAGTLSSAGYAGDGAAATSAKLSGPSGVAVNNKTGIVYIADAGNNRIRQVSGGTITTIAGNGTAGYSGDGAAATSAEISNPTGVAVDETGNVFFIDKGNARVRRVDASTKYISTILNNSHSITGIAVDKAGNIYVSDSTASQVIEITPGTFATQVVAGNGTAGYSGDGGAATSAELNYPGGLMVDLAGNVYVGDIGNNVVRKFKPGSTPPIAGNVISTTDSTVTCYGQVTLHTLTGTVPTGGTGTYTYQWKQSPDSVNFTAINGATSQNYAVNATITTKTFYRRFVTSGSLLDSGNAIGFHPRTKPVPTISLGSGSATICQGIKDTLTASAGFITYAWSSGASTQKFIDSVSGTYTVAVTDSFGCTGTSAPQVITVNAAPATPTITASPTTTTNLCAGATATLTSSTGSAYKWSNGATTSSITVSAAGLYTVSVSNSSGCYSATSAAQTVSYSSTATPTIAASPAATTNLCPGTSVTLTSSTASTYKWSTGATTSSISVTTAGSYTVTTTNASGCTGTSTATTVSYTTAPATPTITASPATTTNLCPGTAVTLTSSTGTTYKWSSSATTASISVTAAGSYTVTVANASGCTATSAATTVSYTTAPATPTITASATTTTGLCPGTAVTLTSSTGTTYKWSTGATTSSISTSTAGSYTVTVANSSGCTATSAAKMVSYTTAPATPTITASPATTTNLCPGTAVTLTSSTGTTYKWSTSATTSSISVTAAGSYTVTVANSAGCTATSAAKTVSYATAPATPTITSSPSTTTNLCSGTAVTLTSSTGTTYKWSTGATTSSISTTTAGSYTVTVSNSTGCTATSAAKAVSYVACSAAASPITTAETGTTATLKWGKVACAVEYVVEYELSTASKWTVDTVKGGSADTTVTISGLTKSSSYKWQVASVCSTSPSVVVSAYSSAVTFKTTSATTVETGVTFDGVDPKNLPEGDGFAAMVYPNPAVNTANLQISGYTGKAVIIITDLSGRAVWQGESHGANNVTLPVANFAAGMYFITIKDEKRAKVLKLVKQ